jgi:hypothetical protein
MEKQPYEALLSAWRVDYLDIQRDVQGSPLDEVARYLLEQLPWEWRDAYCRNTIYETDIVESPEGALIYQFDTRVVEETDASLKAGRLIAVYGRVGEIAGARLSSAQLRQRFLGPTEKSIGPVDKGHFIAHSLGGSSSMNLFPQDRRLNRGWSEDGKKYRSMESFAADRPGTFVFHRPIYSDGTLWPRCFEFGLLKPDSELWVEVFDNERPPGAII